MAFNGDGTFSFPYNWALDAANGIPITASRMDTQFLNCTQGFDLCMTRDAQGAPTASIPFAFGLTSDAIAPVTSGGPVALTGVTSGAAAASGKVGEYIESSVGSGPAISLTNTVPSNVTSISLTPGDWDVTAQIGFIGTSSTTVSYFIGSISSTSATLNTNRSDQVLNGITPFSILATVNYAIYPVKFTVSTTTIVYLVAQSGFGTSTNAAFGVIRARRVR